MGDSKEGVHIYMERGFLYLKMQVNSPPARPGCLENLDTWWSAAASDPSATSDPGQCETRRCEVHLALEWELGDRAAHRKWNQRRQCVKGCVKIICRKEISVFGKTAMLNPIYSQRLLSHSFRLFKMTISCCKSRGSLSVMHLNWARMGRPNKQDHWFKFIACYWKLRGRSANSDVFASISKLLILVKRKAKYFSIYVYWTNTSWEEKKAASIE